MREFLRSPAGWFALLFAECAALLLLRRALLGRYPDSRVAIAWLIVVLAVLLVVGNFLLRRRYLSER